MSFDQLDVHMCLLLGVLHISHDQNELEKIAIEDDTSGDQLNLTRRRVVMSVDLNDFDSRLVIGPHETSETDVEEDLTDLREGDGEQMLRIGKVLRLRSKSFLSEK